MPTSAIQLRQLIHADVPFAMRLKNLAGWNQTEADWQRFLELEPQGCFVAEYESKPAGTATAIRFGQRFGWIGMMLVDPDRRRLGIASALLQQAVGYLDQQQVETSKLDATPAGKTVYDQCGFKDEYRIERRVRPGSGEGQYRKLHTCTPVLPRDVDGLAEFDAPVFGADRRRLLATLLRDGPDLCFHTHGGFVMGRRGTSAAQIGPLVAADAAVAEQLLRTALGVVGTAPAFVDVPLCNPAAVAVSTKLGFEKQRELIRQYRGPNRYPGDCQKIYGIAGPELG